MAVERKRRTPGVRWDAKRERFFIDYYDGNGRRHREYGLRGQPFRSQKEAADALASRRASILADRYEWKSREVSPPFGELLNWYLETYSPEKKSHQRDKTSAKPVRAFFGAKRVAEITPEDVQTYKVRRRQTISRRTKQPIQEATVDLELNLLKAVFSRAVEAGKAKTNPVKAVKLYRPDNRRGRVLTAAERGKLFAALPAYVRPIVRVLLETSLRVEAVMSLRRENIQFRDGGTVIRIRDKGGEWKTIAVSQDLTNMLHAVVKSLPASEGSSAPLWRKPNGQPLKSFRTAWENACARAGIKNLWRHDLRRTFGTLALEVGTDLKTIQEILDHSHLTTTERYLCPEVKRQRDAMEAVSARLLGSGWAATASDNGIDIHDKPAENKPRAGVAE